MTNKISLIGLLMFILIYDFVPVEAQYGEPFTDELDSQDSSRWRTANGWANGSVFNVGWRSDHVTFSDGVMSLELDDVPCPDGCSDYPYASGEYRTRDFFTYGYFEARIKASDQPGTVSSLFTYTGPSDGNEAHEIDIEILGKNPTQMQTNYFTDSVGGHETYIDLGFDASADFHTYGFEWTSDAIHWYVDGELVHTEDGSRGTLPSIPGRIMVNYWPGINVDAWLDPFVYNGASTAQYDMIRYAPAAPYGEDNAPLNISSQQLVEKTDKRVLYIVVAATVLSGAVIGSGLILKKKRMQ